MDALDTFSPPKDRAFLCGGEFGCMCALGSKLWRGSRSRARASDIVDFDGDQRPLRGEQILLTSGRAGDPEFRTDADPAPPLRPDGDAAFRTLADPESWRAERASVRTIVFKS